LISSLAVAAIFATKRVERARLNPALLHHLFLPAATLKAMLVDCNKQLIDRDILYSTLSHPRHTLDLISVPHTGQDGLSSMP
jgi:hypothetical protein